MMYTKIEAKKEIVYQGLPVAYNVLWKLILFLLHVRKNLRFKFANAQDKVRPLLWCESRAVESLLVSMAT